MFFIFGSVGFTNLKWFNKVPIALAPLLLVPLSFIIMNYIFSNYNLSLVEILGLSFFVIILLINSIPSSVDFQQARSSMFGLIFWLGFILYLIFPEYVYQQSLKFINSF
jgi:hypothetical protein